MWRRRGGIGRSIWSFAAGEMVNVYTGEIARADIGIFGDRIAVVDFGGAFGLTAREEIDARGLIAMPGFVDTHVHIESTMVTPPNFARGVLPFGTTTVVIDPHEIGNVTGRAGVEYMLRASEGLPLARLCHRALVRPGGAAYRDGGRGLRRR